jgi:hypothetical protein
MSLCGTVVVFLCPADAKESGLPLWYFSVVAGAAVCNSLAGDVTFTSMSAFFTRIGDPAIGGTCVLVRCDVQALALLLTSLCRYITLLNTVSNIGGLVPQTGIMFVAEWVQSMVGQAEGYYACVCGCVALGLALMPLMMKLVHSVETLPLSEWRVSAAVAEDREMNASGYIHVSSDEGDAPTQHYD